MHGVSFDLSKRRTGICLWKDQLPVHTYNVTFNNTKSLGELIDYFEHVIYDDLLFHGELHHFFNRLDWYAYEDVRPVNKHHMEQHFGMVAALHRAAYIGEIPIYAVTATSVKKILSGEGKASKEDQLRAAREQYPHLKVSNHDEADALGVGLYVIRNKLTWD